MMHTVEREATNNLIVKMLIEGKTHKVIASELGVGVGQVGDIAKANNLERCPKPPRYVTTEGKTLEDIRKANPYKVGDKVSIRVKLSDDDKAVRHNCTVEQVTPCVVYARDEKGLMHSAMFAEIGIKTAKGAELIRKRE